MDEQIFFCVIALKTLKRFKASRPVGLGAGNSGLIISMKFAYAGVSTRKQSCDSNELEVQVDKLKVKIYDHVFITEHFLQGEWKRFDTSYYMAESFRRLSEGKEIQPHDMILLGVVGKFM